MFRNSCWNIYQSGAETKPGYFCQKGTRWRRRVLPGTKGNPCSVWGPVSYTIVLRARGQTSPDSFQDESAATIFLRGILPLGIQTPGGACCLVRKHPSMNASVSVGVRAVTEELIGH